MGVEKKVLLYSISLKNACGIDCAAWSHKEKISKHTGTYQLVHRTSCVKFYNGRRRQGGGPWSRDVSAGFNHSH